MRVTIGAVQRQALVDSLTGLANRRLCEAALRRKSAARISFGEALSLVVEDIDDFKNADDRHGRP